MSTADLSRSFCFDFVREKANLNFVNGSGNGGVKSFCSYVVPLCSLKKQLFSLAHKILGGKL